MSGIINFILVLAVVMLLVMVLYFFSKSVVTLYGEKWRSKSNSHLSKKDDIEAG